MTHTHKTLHYPRQHRDFKAGILGKTERVSFQGINRNRCPYMAHLWDKAQGEAHYNRTQVLFVNAAKQRLIVSLF